MITTDIFKFICQSLIYRLDCCFIAAQFPLFKENKKWFYPRKLIHRNLETSIILCRYFRNMLSIYIRVAPFLWPPYFNWIKCSLITLLYQCYGYIKKI